MQFIRAFSNTTLSYTSPPILRFLSNDIVSSLLTNRNPRNLERLRIGYKPDGYHVESPGRRYWHKLQLSSSGKYVTATIIHYTSPVPVLVASTQEWSLKGQLYRYKDSSAYMNLGRVFAQRCLQCGLTEMYNDINVTTDKFKSKEELFLQALRDAGICLNEPSQYKVIKPWDQHRPEKPWEDNSYV